MHILCPHCANAIEIVDHAAKNEVACPSCGSSFSLEGGSTTDWQPHKKRLGKFDLLEKVGQGAFGTVYKARDPELDRLVAVKVPRIDNLPDSGDLDRFLREARSVAQLRHPSIVAVHEVGQSEGIPYLVSDFVEGVTLSDYLTGRQPSHREAAAWIEAAAEALHYAHQRGVIHRDVKPSNIMLEQVDSTTPTLKLMDFGLAKREAGEITMTLDGTVLGTPAYMSPEQARGTSHQVDGRSDVYSLGVILYRMLTGELPFRGTHRMLLHQVLHDEPRGPRSLNDRIPRDLETICLKAMAKEPPRRYLTAAALADDLRRWLKGEPIQARPVGRLERATKWVRRNRGLSAGLATAVLALVVGMGIATWQAVEAHSAADKETKQREATEKEKLAADEARNTAVKEKKEADIARKATDKALKQAKRELRRFELMHYIDHIVAADKALQENDFITARYRLEECRLEFRHVEHAYLSKQLAHNSPSELRHTHSVSSLALSADGQRLFSGSWDQTIKVWNLAAGKDTLTLRGHVGLVSSLALSADGKRLFSGSWDRTIKVWDLAAGKDILTLHGHTEPVSSLALSADGKRLVSGSGGEVGEEPNPGEIKVWDLAAGKDVLTLRGHAEPVSSLALSADGKRLYSGSADKTIKVWDLEAAGKEPLTLRGHTGAVTGLALSADGKRLVSGSGYPDSAIKVWDLEAGKETLTLRGHQGGVSSLALSADGKRLFSGGHDQTIKAWDLKAGKDTLTVRGHARSVTGLALSANGKWLFSGSEDQTIKVWDLEAAKDTRTLRGHKSAVMSLALSADGKRLVSDSQDQTIRVWDLEAGKDILTLRGNRNGVSSLALSADGKRLYSGGGNPSYQWGKIENNTPIKVWDLAAGKDILTLCGHKDAVSSLALSADGKRLYSGSYDMTIKVWDLEAGKDILTLRGHTSSVSSLALSADGKRLFSGSHDYTFKVWDLAAGKDILTQGGHKSQVNSLALSADGELLFLGGVDQTIKVWDLAAGKVTLTLRGHAHYISSLALSADGKRLFSGSWDQTIKLWDLEAGKEALTLRGHKSAVTSLALSADGKRLYSGSYDMTIKVWDLEAGK